MTRQVRIMGCLLGALFVSALPAVAGGDVNFLFGQKAFDDDTLDAAHVDGGTQFGLALTLDFDWPVDLAFDLLAFSDDATTTVFAGMPIDFATYVETLEFDVGIRKLWGDRLQPYVGGGIAFVKLDATQWTRGSLGSGSSFVTLVVDDSDSALGFWANAGLLYRLTAQFNLGIDLRYSDADVKLIPEADPEPAELAAGGTHFGLSLGFHW